VESHLSALKQEEYLLLREEKRVQQQEIDEAARQKRDDLEKQVKAMSMGRKQAAKQASLQLRQRQRKQQQKYQAMLEGRLLKLQESFAIKESTYGSASHQFIVPLQSSDMSSEVRHGKSSFGSSEFGGAGGKAYGSSGGLRGSSSMPRLGGTQSMQSQQTASGSKLPSLTPVGS